MTPDQSPGEPGTSTPPRPNLGPEPWPEEAWPRSAASWSGLAFAAVLLVGLWAWRRRRAEAPSSGSLGPAGSPIESDPDPSRRLIASSEAARGALIAALGPAWASKTTEEMADESGLADRLGATEFAKLIELLRLADRVKFAGAEPGPVDHWEAWAGSFASVLGR